MISLNLLKIIYIMQRENYAIITGDLARLSEIHYKNIGRYLNFLEDKDLVSRDVYQEKKKRFILNSLTWRGRRFIIPKFHILFLKNFYES